MYFYLKIMIIINSTDLLKNQKLISTKLTKTVNKNKNNFEEQFN